MSRGLPKAIRTDNCNGRPIPDSGLTTTDERSRRAEHFNEAWKCFGYGQLARGSYSSLTAGIL